MATLEGQVLTFISSSGKAEGPERLADVGWTLVGGAFMSAPELRGGICPVLVGASLAIILCPY